MSETTYYLTLNRCPKHGVESVSLDERNADSGGCGTRLTRTKCCGTWREVKRWKMDAYDLRCARDLFGSAADAVEARDDD